MRGKQAGVQKSHARSLLYKYENMEYAVYSEGGFIAVT